MNNSLALFIACKVSVGLFFSLDILVFDFLHFEFSKCNTYIIAGNITLKDYVEISIYLFMEVINWKENKEVGTLCFEVRIPTKGWDDAQSFLYATGL